LFFNLFGGGLGGFYPPQNTPFHLTKCVGPNSIGLVYKANIYHNDQAI
jgi:hypothetical protein